MAPWRRMQDNSIEHSIPQIATFFTQCHWASEYYLLINYHVLWIWQEFGLMIYSEYYILKITFYIPHFCVNDIFRILYWKVHFVSLILRFSQIPMSSYNSNITSQVFWNTSCGPNCKFSTQYSMKVFEACPYLPEDTKVLQFQNVGKNICRLLFGKCISINVGHSWLFL